MRFMNLLSVGALLALAGCGIFGKGDDGDDGTDEGDADADADADTDVETTDTATGDTGTGGDTGPWEVLSFYELAFFALDADNNLVDLDTPEGPIAPIWIITLISEDDEECSLGIDLTNAVVSPGVGDQYLTITADNSNNEILVDGCAGIAEFGFAEGFAPGDLWAGATFVITLGPFDSAFWDGAGLDEDITSGGTFSDGVIFGYTGYPAEPVYTQAFEITPDGYDYTEPLPADSIPSGAGVIPAFYILGTYTYTFTG